MLKYLTGIILMLCCIATAQANQHKVMGKITDTTDIPLAGTSVSLLYPEDSTLAFFGITNVNGAFTIPNVKEGNYLLQVAMMGYYTAYQKVSIPTDNILGTISLKVNDAAHVLNEVIISGEKVPIRVKGDTLEYNAGSYKVKPDAMVEDLLRKLPGVQVDKEGNIKSMGKDVKKVLVDGKEFFGDDPKIATKNLPANAVDKVQAFDKRSDGSLFSGIDDGTRETTLNLMLKEDSKSGYFGTVQGGIGLPEQYDASVRAFKFRSKSQLAALGMINNINKFGFTFQDYIDFNGGLSSLMQGGGTFRLDANEMPVDFGQPVTGKVTSGAAGLNYTIEPWKKSRLTFNYMGNGMKKFLDQYVDSRNYTPNAVFEKNDHTESNSENLKHKVSASWRSEIDSVNMFTGNAYAQLGNGENNTKLQSESFLASLLQNSLNNSNNVTSNIFDIGGQANWVKKTDGNWVLLQAGVNGSYSKNKEKSDWYNVYRYAQSGQEITDNQYRNNDLIKTSASLSLSAVRKLGNGFFLVPSVTAVYEKEEVKRLQGLYSDQSKSIDSLSPGFYRNVFSVSPGLALKRNTKDMRWNIGLNWEAGTLMPFLNEKEMAQRNYQYLLPSAWWQKDFGLGKHLRIQYNTDITTPGALQLLPVTDYSNPLLRTSGNLDLKPEYAHNLNLNYHLFDQFSMTTFFVMLNGKYTKDKIDWGRVVHPDLSQDWQTINTSYAFQGDFSTQYARPVRKLGIQASVGWNETWQRTLTPVNGINNVNNTWKHELELSFNNINNDVWDFTWGGSFTWSSAKYSLNKELNNTYYNYAGFLRASYRPTENWNFSLSGDITHYTAKSFDEPVTIPLLKAELSRYILHQRGTISITGFDLLNQNKAIQRISQLNYLMEQRSNTIGRYVMLTFAYKLNKVGNGSPGGIEIRNH